MEKCRGKVVVRGGRLDEQIARLIGIDAMKKLPHAAALWVAIAASTLAGENRTDESPADHLPAHITQMTWFGERADWSHDGKRILFLSKTFGDAMEIDLESKRTRIL